MSFVVIAYPKISPQDYRWIQDIRKEHDLVMYSVVEPHITFVFPTTKLNAEELTSHVKSHLKGFKSFPVTFDSTKVVKDDFNDYTHTFLVPSVGFDYITKLHDQLYVDDMLSELRTDIPFIPHLGIGTNPSKTTMEELAKTISESNKVITGSIDQLVVCEFNGKKVTELTTLPLA